MTSKNSRQIALEALRLIGKAEEFDFTGCKDGRVVADVMRMDKGHTEGLEPNVTERLVKLMLSAKGGKIAASAS